MSRLTHRAEEDGVKAVWYGERDVFLEGEVGYAEADKLARYEDLEEQGLLTIIDNETLQRDDLDRCTHRHCNKCDKYRRDLQRYKDLEDEGRLMELPCAVGDTIYDPETGKPFDKVIQFVIDENGVHCKTLSVLAEMEGAE